MRRLPSYERGDRAGEREKTPQWELISKFKGKYVRVLDRLHELTIKT